MYSVQVIHRGLKPVPTFWINFLEEVSCQKSDLVPILKDYNAVYRYLKLEAYLDFDTEADAVAFILKYS